MRRAVAVAIAVLGLSLGSATPAEAQSFWRWLESLSGPGPFKSVFGIEFAPVCFGDNPTDPDNRWLDLFCTQNRLREPRVSFVFDVAWGSGTNNLTYAPGATPNGVADTGVFLFSGGPMWHLHDRAVDVGAVVGVARFSNLPVVGAVSKSTIEPRLVFRPLVLMRGADRYRMSFLEIRYSPIIVFSGFTLADFGAVGGDLTGDPETIHSVQILVNIAPLIRR
ncbi:MAG TPA: hypothetical protein VMM93_02215 [Vicinamibacterales bacterium]|nr:hypothetical protein [Vicinamibacterales bacterium]